jgi:hypothetical protein
MFYLSHCAQANQLRKSLFFDRDHQGDSDPLRSPSPIDSLSDSTPPARQSADSSDQSRIGEWSDEVEEEEEEEGWASDSSSR